MKRLNIFYTAVAGICILFNSCTDDLQLPATAAGDPALPLSLSAAYPSVSRASDAGFDHGDLMGVYVLDYEGDNAQDINDPAARASNIRFTFDGSDNSWTGATDIYWRDNDTPADIIGYYPYSSVVDNPLAMHHTIERRQDIAGSESRTGGYEASDLLWGKASKAMPTSAPVNLVLGHLMAGVRVTLLEGDGFSPGEWAQNDKKVLVNNIIPSGNVNLADGTVEVGTGDAIGVTPLEYNGEYRAVVFPQTVETGKCVIAVTVGTESYNLVRQQSMDYVQGKMHGFTITVNKKDNGSLEFSLTDEAITPWLDDADFRDGIIREYVTVDVPDRGGLEAAVNALGLEAAKIYNLKITGEVNERDFEFIRTQMNYLGAINLCNAKVFEGESEDVLPFCAMEGMRTLRHIVFPAKLRVINTAALAGTGLMGDLIIPEGVTHIGTRTEVMDANMGGLTGPFGDCPSLVGELSLPSTVQFIEGRAFHRTPLSGNLILPDGLRYIGPQAFGGCGFTGELHLPDNLETLLEGAFSGVPFTGSLTIPPGIKVLEPFAFSGCGFNGTLQLPEGLIEIRGAAFRDCKFRGELNLPAGLKRICSEAFARNKISGVFFPESLVFIGQAAFDGCDRLQGTVTLPAKISNVSELLFSGCTLLSEVKLHEDITVIEGGAFKNCYNLASVICDSPEPPLLKSMHYDSHIWAAFEGVPKDNFTLQVPEQAINAYRNADGWKEFRRIAAYSNFVCRPAKVSALGNAHDETVVLNSDGPWTVTHKPSWINISAASGSGKTELRLSFTSIAPEGADRDDYIEFTLDGSSHTTRCDLSQYSYRYSEDECIRLQQATSGNGIDVLFVGEGFDAAAIASGDYLSMVNEQMEYFFGVEPYRTYRSYFNVYACMSLSQDTGINTDNLYNNTRFGALYTMGRLMLDNADDVFDYAVAHSPLTRERMPQSLIIMALNSDEYGSATTLTDRGSAIAMVCRSSDSYPMDSRGILQHEACGHAFGKLAEERITRNQYLSNGERQAIADAHSRGWYRNISTTGKLSDVPWSRLIFDPRYSDKVDVFEGGFGKTRGCFRAEINSCMNYGIPYFSAAARQAIVQRILDFSGEGFSLEKFFARDSDSWGATAARAGGETVPATHNPVIIFKSRKY